MAWLPSLRNTEKMAAPKERAISWEKIAQWIPGGVNHVGANVDRALAVPAFLNAVRIKADALATTPLRLYRVDNDGNRVQLPELPAIIAEPEVGRFLVDTLTDVCVSLMLKGNAYLFKADFDDDGFPRQVLVLNPDHVDWMEDRQKWVIGGKDFGREYEPWEVLHIRGFGVPGCKTGVSIVELFRSLLEGELYATEYQNDFYRYGAVPSVVISTKAKVSTETKEDFIRRWISNQAGGRRPVILDGGDYSVSPVLLSNRDAQWLESRQFSLVTIANMVGISVTDLNAAIQGGGSSQAYQNVETEQIRRWQTYLKGLMVRIEQAFTTLVPEGLEVKFDLNDLMRMDSKTLWEVNEIQARIGAKTVDEMRADVGMGPMPSPNPEAVDPNLWNSLVNLIRVGADPKSACAAMGLPPIEFTNPIEPALTPVSKKAADLNPQDEADE